MAMNDISLTTGMRKNLVQLQSTMTLLDRTQERLATGKKVNSALDNPINFFAAKGHLSRAADIALYKDGMAEAIQTIQAANNGIKSIQALIESTRSLANSALTANPNQMGFEVLNTISTIVPNNVVTIGGTAFTAVACTAATIGQTGNFFVINDTDGTTELSVDLIAANLAAKINSNVETGVAGNLKAIYSGSRITLQSVAQDNAITGTAIVADDSGFITKDSTITSERTILAEHYEELLIQIDVLANSSGYKGFNLLNSETLQVNFEGGSISVKGFSAYASDMGVNTTGAAQSSLSGDGIKWALAKDIKYDLNKMEKGILKLKNESLKLSLNLSAITIQQEFSVAKINLLNEGADNLITADTNEEGANMLMLQTRQSLGTTALSLSSQAAQSVLRLFA